MIGFTLALLLMMAPGALLVLLLKKTVDAWELAAGAFGLGVGGFTFLMFLLGIIGIPWQQWILISIALAVTATLAFFVWKRHRSGQGWKHPSRLIQIESPLAGKVTVAIVLLLFAAVAVSAMICTLYWPVYAWDALMMHHYRALVFHHFKGLEFGLYKDARPAYPLMMPLAHCLMMELGATEEKLLYPLFLLALLFMLIHLFKRLGALPAGVLAALLIGSTPELWRNATIAYPTLPGIVLVTFGWLYFYEWYFDPNRRLLFFAYLFCGLGAWARIEGVMWFALMFFAGGVLSFLRRRGKDWLIVVSFGLVLCASWPVYYVTVWKQPDSVATAKASLDFKPEQLVSKERWSVLADALSEHLHDLNSFGGFWLLAAVAVIFSLLRWNFFSLVQLAILFLGVLGTLAMVMVVDDPLVFWKILLRGGLRRLILYLVPLSSVLLATQWIPRGELSWSRFRGDAGKRQPD